MAKHWSGVLENTPEAHEIDYVCGQLAQYNGSTKILELEGKLREANARAKYYKAWATFAFISWFSYVLIYPWPW